MVGIVIELLIEFGTVILIARKLHSRYVAIEEYKPSLPKICRTLTGGAP